MIQTAIVGLGRWGRSLVKASLGHQRIKIVRAVEPDIKAAQGFCAQHQLELTGNLDTILADGAIAAVFPAGSISPKTGVGVSLVHGVLAPMRDGTRSIASASASRATLVVAA